MPISFVNPSFESLSGWTPFTRLERLPSFNIESTEMGARATRDGHSARMAVDGFLWGGLMQTVEGVGVGDALTFTSWALGFGSQDTENIDRNDIRKIKTLFRVGIDPTGGANPVSENVVWSPGAGLDFLWVGEVVQAQAQHDRATLFVEASIGDHADKVNGWAFRYAKAFFDTCVLTSVPAAPPPPPPPAAEWRMIRVALNVTVGSVVAKIAGTISIE